MSKERSEVPPFEARKVLAGVYDGGLGTGGILFGYAKNRNLVYDMFKKGRLVSNIRRGARKWLPMAF